MKKWMAAAVVAASLVTGMTVGGVQPAENVYAAAKDDIPLNVNPVQIFLSLPFQMPRKLKSSLPRKQKWMLWYSKRM